MKTFRVFKESIIDTPRITYAPGVFDNADTPDPKIKASVKKLIDAQIKEFAKEYPVIKIGLVGSILTKRYRNDADLDINVLFDVPKDKREDERIRLSKQFLSASNPDNIQGKLIPGTEHPINYYLITDSKTYQDQEDKADAVFDIKTNKFIKRPEDYTFDLNLYLKDFQKKVDEIDVVKGELKRDIVDYDELKELKAGDIKNLQDKVNGKLKEIEKDIQDIIKIGDTVDAERRAAFDTDMSPDEIKTFSIKNRLPKNVVYKMLEKYHYLKFWKKCKKILDDDKVTDAEIDSLKTESKSGDELEHLKLMNKALKTFAGSPKQKDIIKQLNVVRKRLGLKPLKEEDYAQSKITRAVQEALDNSKKLIFAFGRFNPPTTGHAKLMKEVIIQARKNNANHIVYASASQDKRSNPLDVKTKVKFMQKMFRQNKIKAAGGTQRTFMEILKFYNKMYGEIVMVAGSDRINEFQKLADKYNGRDYDYKSIKVVSSGERDPDAEGVTGMSASKMREMAKNNDYRSFKKGVVNLSDSDTKALFNAVKKGMDIRESYVGKFTDFVNNDLREEYHQQRIFNVGDMIEHTDGSKGMIVRRGANYVSYESDGIIKKAWLYDVSMCEEQLAASYDPTLAEKVKDLPRFQVWEKGNDKKDFRIISARDEDHVRKQLSHIKKELIIKKISKISESPASIKNWIKRNITQRNRVSSAIKYYKVCVKKGIKEPSNTVAKLFGFDYREFADMIRANGLQVETSLIDELSKEHGIVDESWRIGTDAYAQHTMRMTPGQPIQNFRKYTEIIKSEDIEKFKNEEETIDKYKKRFKERWKEELDKAVQRMKEEL